MDEMLLKDRLEVGRDLDRVVLIVNRTHYPMPYAMSFKIAAGLRLASKQAMKFSGEGIKDWRTRSLLDVYTGVEKLSSEKRTTLTKRYSWRIDVDSEIVHLFLNEQKISIHFESALKLAEWLRMAGKSAKRWAGDDGRSMVAAGNLVDAEFNYKHGF